MLGGFHLGRPQKFWIFYRPPLSANSKFTQPSLKRLLTMSAFEGTLSADVLNGSPLIVNLAKFCLTVSRILCHCWGMAQVSQKPIVTNQTISQW